MIIEVFGKYINPDKIIKLEDSYIYLEPVNHQINSTHQLYLGNHRKKDIADAINQAIYETANKYKLKDYINKL